MPMINAAEILKAPNGQNLKDQDGTDLTVGKTLAAMLFMKKETTGGGMVAAYQLGMQLNRATGEFELSTQDVTRLVKAIEESTYSNIVTGRLLEILEVKAVP